MALIKPNNKGKKNIFKNTEFSNSVTSINLLTEQIRGFRMSHVNPIITAIKQKSASLSKLRAQQWDSLLMTEKSTCCSARIAADDS